MNTQGGFAGSLEGGCPIRLGGGWMIEPQGQGVYQMLGLDNGGDVAATVKFDNAQSLAGRVSARFATTWNAEGALISAWLPPNLWYEFLGDAKTSFSSATGFIPFRADLGDSWAELNGGVSAREPGPNDPVFFDPDKDVPTPIDPARLDADLEKAIQDAGFDPAKAEAIRKLLR